MSEGSVSEEDKESEENEENEEDMGQSPSKMRKIGDEGIKVAVEEHHDVPPSQSGHSEIV